MATNADDLAGMLLGGRYRIESSLGRGGMGAVYVAHDEKLGGKVAVKVVKQALLDDAHTLERFRREARLLPELVHPHIVRAYGTGEDDGLLWIAMELITGTSLRTRVEERGRMSWRESLDIVRQIAGALAAAHDKHVIHRDLKPENVMLVDRGPGASPDVRLLDFGVAKAPVRDGSIASMTGTGLVIGTPGYIAPEVILEASDEDARSDLYALGVVWFELVTGARPFSAKTPVALAMAHASNPPPSPSSLVPFQPLPAPIDHLILRLMAKKPDERPDTARDLVALLDRIELEADAAERSPTRRSVSQSNFPTMTDLVPTPQATASASGEGRAVQAEPATSVMATPATSARPASVAADTGAPTPARAGADAAAMITAPASTPAPPTTGVHLTPKMLAAGAASAVVIAVALVGSVVLVLSRPASAPDAPPAPITPPPEARPSVVKPAPNTQDADRHVAPAPVGVQVAAGPQAPGPLASEISSGEPRVQTDPPPRSGSPRAPAAPRPPLAKPVPVEAARMDGRLTVRVLPRGIQAGASVDGRRPQGTPIAQDKWPAGRHRVAVTIPSLSPAPFEFDVLLEADKTSELVIDGLTGERIK